MQIRLHNSPVGAAGFKVHKLASGEYYHYKLLYIEPESAKISNTIFSAVKNRVCNVLFIV